MKSKPNYLTIPFRITGIYSLYLVLKFLKENIKVPGAIEIFEKNYITNELKVLPPNLRLLSYDAVKKEIRTPDINKFYTSILRLNKINAPLTPNILMDEEDWIGKIKVNLKDHIFDQDIIESTVIEYDLFAAKFQFHVNQIYASVYDQLSGKLGLIRSSILGKNIEFSARSVIRVDPSLKPYEIKVSKKILKKLWMPLFLHWLTTVHNLDYDYAYEHVLLYDIMNSDEIDNLFDQFLKWFCKE